MPRTPTPAARRTGGRRFRRGATPLLTLLCVGTLATGCAGRAQTPPTAVPNASSPPGRAAPAAPAAPAQPSEAPQASEAAPLRSLAIADPAPPSPAPKAAPGAPADTAADSPDAPRPGPRDAHRHHALPAPEPEEPPGRGSSVCDLAEQYGKWNRGSSQAASCHAVYG